MIVATVNGKLSADFDNQDVIDDLKELLRRAEAGEIIGFAYASATQDGGIATGWAGVHGSRWPIAAAVGVLQTRYMRALHEN